MDIIEVIKMDLHMERERVQDILELLNDEDAFCSPESVAEFADSFQSDRAAMEKILFQQEEIKSKFQDDIAELRQMNERIDVLVRDLGQSNCAEDGYQEGFLSIGAEVDTRNAKAHELFRKIEGELGSEKKDQLVTEYERLREYESMHDPLQEPLSPSQRNDQDEQNRFL